MPENQPETYSLPPPASEQLLPPSAAQQLYNVYTDRISDFPGFRQRPFSEARQDFTATVHEANDSASAEEIEGIIHTIVSKEGFEAFKTDLSEYFRAHDVETNLSTYSYAFVSNHELFTDLPVEAAAVRSVRRGDPHAASRNILVDARMIPGMEIDIFGTGDYTPVTPLLSLVARQIQTVPKIPKDASEEMNFQRRIWNNEAKAALANAASHPGSFLYIAASGTHDEVSADKSRLTMRSVNPQTAELLANPRLIVIPIFFSCPSVTPAGIRPAAPRYSLLEPRVLNSPEEMTAVMNELAGAGSELLADKYPKGVHYEHSLRDSVRKMGKIITARGHKGSDSPY